MCGIAGFWADIAPGAIEAATARMTAAMVHRGPDDDGVEILPVRHELLALGARRLAIQDPSFAGHQPMHDAQTGNWLVFNGEIYNFRELRSELDTRGVRFVSGTDTEVLLRAYGVWGLECVHRLRGMFAFALWDARARRLILCRDPLGVKPLYYARVGGGLLFASEVRALLRSGHIPQRLSHAGVASYLALGAVAEPQTIVEGIECLPAGHYAVWQGSELSIRRHWSLEDCYRRAPLPSSDRGEITRLVRCALAESVRRRLISDAPVGIFLSGGLDSSTITAVAAQQTQDPLRTVSVVFAEHAFSEKRYVDLLRERYPTLHVEYCLSDTELMSLLSEGLGAMDQPTFDGLNTYAIARQARRAGLNVVLSGLGGDELFGGYPSFHRVPALRLTRRCIPSILRGPAAQAVLIAGRQNDRARKLARWVAADHSTDGAPEALLRELFAPGDRHRLTPTLAAPGRNGRFCADRLGGDDIFNAVSYFEMSHYLRNVLLRDTDAMGMAHSVEVRAPFLDRDLVELVAALPGAVKRAGGGVKPLLAQAMTGELPDAILTRRKMGFSLPFDRWLRGPLGRSLEDTLLDTRLGGEVAEVLNPDAVREVLDRFRAGSASWVRVWSLYVLKQWGAQHLECP
jgi:asparagine synthase (glutamine-hydrolysing)